jgi:hypothetical protein
MNEIVKFPGAEPPPQSNSADEEDDIRDQNEVHAEASAIWKSKWAIWSTWVRSHRTISCDASRERMAAAISICPPSP